MVATTFKAEILDGLKHAIEQSKNLNALAQSVNVSQQNLFNWVNGKTAPTLNKISEVMDALGAHVVFPWTKQDTFFEDFNSQLLEMKKKIDELNSQVANYKVITESYHQLFTTQKVGE